VYLTTYPISPKFSFEPVAQLPSVGAADNREYSATFTSDIHLPEDRAAHAVAESGLHL
jgi:hypothetical protein